MSKKKTNPKIALIGPYPPPYGGISVHIQRVLFYLEQVKYHNYDVYYENRAIDGISKYHKFYGLGKLFSLIRIFFKKYTLIHHHSPDQKARIILGIYGMLGKNIYLHIHGASLRDTIKATGIKSTLTRNFLRFVNIIADNKDIADLAKKYRAKSVVLIDAFLPPLYKDGVYKKLITKHGRELQKKYVISMVGWISYYEGKDLYGFDTALQALIRFKKEVDEKVLLLASINGIRSEELHQKIKNYIIKNNLTKNILFVYGNLPEIWPIYIVSNVFIRPTCSDGSALSIKEAMWFETPVIASDCIPRPEGVILFKNRSPDELFRKLTQVYKSNNGLKNAEHKIRKVKNKNFKYKLFDEIYKLNYEGRK